MKHALIWILVSTLWMIPLEWITRAFVRSHGDSLQAARLIQRPDESLGWRQRSDLDTTFQGRLLKTNRLGFRAAGPLPDHPRVWILGPSSSFGWGVGEGETYSDFLQRELGSPVVNSGEIGYSIVQGEKLYGALRDQLKLSPPPFVVIAYGINDVDHFRFFGKNGPTDEQSFIAGDWGSPLLNECAITAILVRAWQETAIYRECGLSQVPRLRVSPSEFKAHLESLTDRILRDGSIPILLNTAFSPKEAHPINPDESDHFYAESARASQEGRCADSRALLKQGRQSETARLIRDVTAINQIVSEAAQSKKLPFLDLAALLGNQDFVDPVHFSVQGNEKVAKALERIISQAERSRPSTHPQ